MLTHLPQLPNTLQILEIYSTGLIALPELPGSLRTLIFRNNSTAVMSELSELPNLPHGLITLECSFCELISLPRLPNTLQVLDITNTMLEVLPILPESLIRLLVSKNNLTALPVLPNLAYLDCDNNFMTELPVLPNDLLHLSCRKNKLTTLPKLPPTLEYLQCSENMIRELPQVLPHTLREIYCSHNQIRSLPVLSLTAVINEGRFRAFDCDWSKLEGQTIEELYQHKHNFTRIRKGSQTVADVIQHLHDEYQTDQNALVALRGLRHITKTDGTKTIIPEEILKNSIGEFLLRPHTVKKRKRSKSGGGNGGTFSKKIKPRKNKKSIRRRRKDVNRTITTPRTQYAKKYLNYDVFLVPSHFSEYNGLSLFQVNFSNEEQFRKYLNLSRTETRNDCFFQSVYSMGFQQAKMDSNNIEDIDGGVCTQDVEKYIQDSFRLSSSVVTNFRRLNDPEEYEYEKPMKDETSLIDELELWLIDIKDNCATLLFLEFDSNFHFIVAYKYRNIIHYFDPQSARLSSKIKDVIFPGLTGFGCFFIEGGLSEKVPLIRKDCYIKFHD
jgi:Leucine-rich repeat (LRR) protein